MHPQKHAIVPMSVIAKIDQKIANVVTYKHASSFFDVFASIT